MNRLDLILEYEEERLNARQTPRAKILHSKCVDMCRDRGAASVGRTRPNNASCLKSRQKNSPPFAGELRVWLKESLFTLILSKSCAKVKRPAAGFMTAHLLGTSSSLCHCEESMVG